MSENRDIRIFKLRNQGYSLRDIGKLVGCSHQTVKRVLGVLSNIETLYHWDEKRKLTRSQIKAELQRIARKKKWSVSREKYIQKWEDEILDLICHRLSKRLERNKADILLERLSWLLADGPARPGNREKRDRDISRHDHEKPGRVDVLSDYEWNDDEGSVSDWEQQLHEYDSIFANPRLDLAVVEKRPRNPPGTESLRCPRCNRRTLYQHPPHRVLSKGSDEWIEVEGRIQYTSTKCRDRSCNPIEGDQDYSIG